MDSRHFIGIDYGAKMAGTTAVCWQDRKQLIIRISAKKQDADRFLRGLIQEMEHPDIFIDAPLSLPGAYYNSSRDYFFREADRLLNAMSPMFLGGLTARAMNLKSDFPRCHFFETYPRQLVRLLGIEEYYKQDLNRFLKELARVFPAPLPAIHDNWHQVDSLLAWFSGHRFREGHAASYGTPEEGRIWV